MRRQFQNGAGRETRRFGRGLSRKGVYLIAMLISFGAIRLIEPYVQQYQLFQDGLGWFLLLGMLLAVVAIYFILRVFAIHLWGRPRHKFAPPKRPGEPRYRRWPRTRT